MDTVIKKEGNVFLVTVNGRFTTDEATGFAKAAQPLMQEKSAAVVMDLAGLDFISSAGLRCLVMLLKACDANATELRLKNLTPQLKDILTLTALIDKFKVE